MLTYLKDNIQLYLVLILWVITGMLAGPAVYAVIPIIILLLQRNERYEEIFIGFWFILILSDNILIPGLGFAKGFKNAYIVLVALIFVLKRKEWYPLNTYYQRFIPFFIVALIALTNSDTVDIGIQKTISYILLFLTVPNYVEKIFRQEGPLFFRRMVFFFILLLSIGIILKYIAPDMAVSHGGRLTGIFGNPNGLGLFCVLTFVLLTVIIEYFPDLFSRREKQVFYLVIIVSLIFAASRNALVSVLIFVFFLRFYRISPFLGFILLMVFGFLTEVISNNFIVIIKTMGLEGFLRIETLEHGAGRYIAWNFAWEQIQHNFFIGKGFGFDEHIMRKNYDFLSRLGHQGGVHNTYLILWMNTGLIGLLLYMISFIGTFIRAAKNTPLAYPIMFTIMFTITFEPWMTASLNPLTIILLIIITMILSPLFNNAGQPVTEASTAEHTEPGDKAMLPGWEKN